MLKSHPGTWSGYWNANPPPATGLNWLDPKTSHSSPRHSRWSMDISLSNTRHIKFVRKPNGVFCRISRADKGIVLGSVETFSLIHFLETIFDEPASSTQTTGPEETCRQHLGFGTFAIVYNFLDRIYCDVRRWCRPGTSDDPVPTRIGIVLNESDVLTILSHQSDIEKLFTLPITPCTCVPQQYCRRCRPFVRHGNKRSNTQTTSSSKIDRSSDTGSGNPTVGATSCATT